MAKTPIKSWESMNDVYYKGMTLRHGGYGGGKYHGQNNGKVSLFYVNQVPMSETPNHFDVTWDFSDFLASEAAGEFDWPSPHTAILIKEERKQAIIEHFSGSKFVPYGREIEFNGRMLTIINRPVEFAKASGALRYFAGATDDEGNVYQVYWNMFNVFEPTEIEMTVDNSRYCKHCLQNWSLNADYSVCEHEWVEDID